MNYIYNKKYKGGDCMTTVSTKSGKIINVVSREEESKKGMDGSQVTGASSSYARKYALNGLFCIDDTKDSDTTNKQVKKLSEAQIKRLYAISKKAGYNAEQIKQLVYKKYEKEIDVLTKDEYDYICKCLEGDKQ